MLIQRMGINRVCSEADYNRKFKSQGYKVIEEQETKSEPKKLYELKANEIRILAEALDFDFAEMTAKEIKSELEKLFDDEVIEATIVKVL